MVLSWGSKHAHAPLSLHTHSGWAKAGVHVSGRRRKPNPTAPNMVFREWIPYILVCECQEFFSEDLFGTNQVRSLEWISPGVRAAAAANTRFQSACLRAYVCVCLSLSLSLSAPTHSCSRHAHIHYCVEAYSHFSELIAAKPIISTLVFGSSSPFAPTIRAILIPSQVSGARKSRSAKMADSSQKAKDWIVVCVCVVCAEGVCRGKAKTAGLELRIGVRACACACIWI